MTLRLKPDWRLALATWQHYGQSHLIEALILRGTPVPRDCRELLADIVTGRAKRPRGNPRATFDVGRTLRNARIVLAHHRLVGEGESATAARKLLATEYHLSPEAIASIVRRYAKRK